MSIEGVFHVVCHDCPTESLRYTESDAENTAAAHTDSTDHHVSVGRLE
ncbi:hypothetical protein [Candidatus Halobonum tyrrellensis]|nr:hypothetical protein [Candidatus Halobonum tyrrellensis]